MSYRLPVATTIPKPIGHWTALKLEYLDHYLQAYRIATGRFQAYYIDLFAGCGDCVLKGSNKWPLSGSPWRALNAIPPFSRYFFVEKNAGLASHLLRQIQEAGRNNAEVREGDCNGPILDEILRRTPRRALSFAFLDPSGLQLHWKTVEKLARHRLGGRKMELLLLYPYDMVIRRWISLPRLADALTAFFGDDSWRIAQDESERLSENDHARRDRFVELYKAKFRRLGYRYVVDYGPLGYRHSLYYHVIFAGDEPLGLKIMDAVWSKTWAIPSQLGYELVRRPGAAASPPSSEH